MSDIATVMHHIMCWKQYLQIWVVSDVSDIGLEYGVVHNVKAYQGGE